MKSCKVIWVLACTLSLSACLKVDDKSNKKVANALNEQTKVLQEQQTSISLSGTVKNLSTDSLASNATVTVKVGTKVSAPVASNNGSFLVEKLPADSDYELTVHSTTGAFMDRTVFGRTRATTSPGSIHQDIGVINVAVGVERRFSILDAATSLPIPNLILHANSNLGTGANPEPYLHTSSYDTTAQQYKITLPERMDIDVYASLDVNSDKKADFLPESSTYSGSGATLLIDSAYVNNPNPIYLSNLNTEGLVKIRMSLVDAALKPILNAKPTISDAMNGVLTAVYDPATEQYVVDAIIANNIELMIPSITVDQKTYYSSTVYIGRVAGSNGLNYSINTSNSSTQVSFAKGDAKILNVVQQLAITPSTPISIANQSTAVDAVTQGFKVFYSSAIAVGETSASLVKRNILHVVKGNESIDIIAPGTTLIETIDEPVAVDAQLSLNNTLLTVTPKAPLPGGSYRYNIGQITDVGKALAVDLSGDGLDFEIKGTAEFDISDMKLDNNNYFTSGVVIKPTNTAGVASTAFYQPAAVYAYLPASIKQLKNLTLRKEFLTLGATDRTSIQDFPLVINGQMNNGYLITAVSVANNENVVGSLSGGVVRGTALSDGSWYGLYVGESMDDNTSFNNNNIRFSYTLETKDGVQKSGNITLPVL